jgi:hypothetical protein
MQGLFCNFNKMTKVISLNNWRNNRLLEIMAKRVDTDKDAYYEKNETLTMLIERQKSFAQLGEDYDKGVWDGLEIAKQIINDFI